MSPKLGAITQRTPMPLQRPDRALARRAAAEVGAGEQDRRAAKGRLVEDAVGVVAAVGAIAQRLEREGAELVAGQRGQALDADDDVGVDVGAQERRGAAPLTMVKGCMLMMWRRARARR